MLVATGSSDHGVYIFDISDQLVLGTETSGNFTQKLAQHTDIVYGVDFHPTEPILATASGDGTVKISTLK
jgi:COMPASS component SWD3